MVAGDWHGYTSQGVFTLQQAEKHDCDVIFQLGDFGYWEHWDDGIRYLEKLNRMSKRHGVPIYWIDGNHENHPLLRETYADRVNDEGFWQIRENIFYCPRGHVWEWDGVRFMGLGGAFSVDRDQRTVGRTFWFEETITEEDVERALENAGGEYVDVMFTHDTPLGVDLVWQMARQGRTLGKKGDRESTYNRILLQDVVEVVQPKWLFHGHMHLRYTDFVKEKDDYRYDGLHVMGLQEGSVKMDSIWVIDTQDIIDLREKGMVDKK